MRGVVINWNRNLHYEVVTRGSLYVDTIKESMNNVIFYFGSLTKF